MPRGVRTEPGPSLYPECGTPGRGGVERHRKGGTVSCQPCRDQAARAALRYKALRARLGHRRVDALGTRRRLQALAALGWPFRVVSVELGWEPTMAQKLTKVDRVWADTAADVRVVYDRLSMTPGPSEQTRRRAARAGWLPPLAWDDDRLDDPDYVSGEQVLRDWDAALAEHKRWRERERKRAARRGADVIEMRDQARAGDRAEEAA